MGLTSVVTLTFTLSSSSASEEKWAGGSAWRLLGLAEEGAAGCEYSKVRVRGEAGDSAAA
jgi:hypothetical protein